MACISVALQKKKYVAALTHNVSIFIEGVSKEVPKRS